MLTRLVLAVIWLWMVRFLSVSANKGEGMPADRNLVINEEITCVHMNEGPNSKIMWREYTSDDDMYSIMLYCHTYIGDGELNCTLTLNATVNSEVCNNENACANCDTCENYNCDHSSKPETDSQELTPTATSNDEEDESETTSSERSQSSNCSYESTTVAALGAIVGVLIALQIFTTVILIWTCWAMKKRQGVNISRKNRNGVDQLTNPTYAEGDNVLSLQPATSPTAMPAYETIALNPRVKVTTSENGEHNYHVLERGQGSSSCTGGGLETIREDEVESSYSKLQLAENEEQEEKEGGGVKKEQDHQYGNLEMLELDMDKVDEANSGRQESDTVTNGENGGLQLESIDAGTDNGEKDVEIESQNDDIILLITTTDNTGNDTTRNTIETGGLKPSTSLEIIHP